MFKSPVYLATPNTVSFCVTVYLPPRPADPTKSFYQFAAQMRFDKKVKGLSLGQGQGVKATRLIEEATQKGTWVSMTL